MAFTLRGAGVTTRSNPKTEYLLMKDDTTLAKGVVVFQEVAGGGLIIAAADQSATTFFVTTEALVNPASGTLSIAAVGSNEFVTVESGGVILPGTVVKVGTGGQVLQWVLGTDDIDERVGVFLRKEGGIITRAAGTSDDELFTDGGDFGVGAAADGDIIEIQVK